MRRVLCLSIVLISCSHSPDLPRADLDLPKAGPAPLEVKGSDPSTLDPKTVFDWQRYYQNPPSNQDQKALSENLETPSNSLDDRLKQARNTLALGRRTEAKGLYTSILKSSPGQLDAQLELTHIYLSENNAERAFDYLSSIRQSLDKVERPSRDYIYRYRFALAQAYIQSQNRKKGHQILTDLIGQEPKFIPAYSALAQSYLQSGKIDLAEFSIKRGLDREPKDPRLTNLLAVVCLRKGQTEEARDWLRKALEKDPNFVPALINRANLAMQRREYALAENDLKKATGLEPLNTEAAIAIGALYRRTGRVSAAKGALERAVELDPLSAAARFHLAGLMADDLKDKTAALQLYYDVLQARDSDEELKTLANIQIQAIRDSRLTH